MVGPLVEWALRSLHLGTSGPRNGAALDSEYPPAAATSGALPSHVTAGIFLCSVETVACFCFAFHWNMLQVKVYCRLFEKYVYPCANIQHRLVKVVCSHLVSDIFFPVRILWCMWLTMTAHLSATQCICLCFVPLLGIAICGWGLLGKGAGRTFW